MKVLIYGLCILLVVAYALASCDISKVSRCQDNYVKKSKDIESSHIAFCKLSVIHINCIKSAGAGCGDYVLKIIVIAKRKLQDMHCKTSKPRPRISGSNRCVAHSTVISGTLVAAFTLKKLLF